jgi:adenylylsulfate kinase-like enzyme
MSSKKSSGGKKEVGDPRLLIICGLPGSGKSTVSKELEKHGWNRVNQG